jgi:hypothetical protein
MFQKKTTERPFVHVWIATMQQRPKKRSSIQHSFCAERIFVLAMKDKMVCIDELRGLFFLFVVRALHLCFVRLRPFEQNLLKL